MPPRDSRLTAEPAAANRERWWYLALFLIVAALAFHFARGLERPWVEEDNWYGAVYSQAAHNNLRAGLHAAGVPATLYFGPLPIPPEAYYVHHPTLLPLLVTGSFAVLGESERSARLVPVLASLASVILLWLLMRDLAGPRAATLGAAIFAVVPMELHYGDMVDFEPVLTLWMLALLACLWRWEEEGDWRWAAASAVCAALALWTDWPGYLFVIAVTISLLFGGANRRGLGAVLGGLVVVAGLLFLLQIRWANASAWDDLWTALRMRLGNAIPTSIAPIAANAPRFTWGDWGRTVLADLRDNYLGVVWLFTAIGLGRVLRQRRDDPGLRWLGWAAAQFFIADAIYVVLLRNESFIHDFAPFYLIGAVAIFGGLGLDALCRAGEEFPLGSRLAIHAAVGCAVVGIAVLGFRRSEAMRSPYLILDGQQKEPPQLIPELGRAIDRAFPAGGTILANFDPYGSALTYYAQRPILTNLLTPSDWAAYIAREHPAGGVIWMGAANAPDILTALTGTTTRIQVSGFEFVLWQPAPAS